MNLDEKYLGRITFPAKTNQVQVNNKNAYSFACPECSHNPNVKRPSKKTFILMYSTFSDCYMFKCHRCGMKGNILTYLQKYQPNDAKEYVKEKWEQEKVPYKKWEKKRWYPTNDLPFNFKPNFESHKN